MTDARLACVMDETVSDRVRVRAWRHVGERTAVGDGAHREVEVAWVLRGLARYRVGRRTIELQPGDAVMLPPEVSHRTLIAPGTTAGSLWLDRALVEGVGAAVGARVADPTRLGDASRVSAIGQLLVAEAAEAGEGRLLAVEALCEALVVASLRAAPSPQPSRSADPRIAAALDHIAAEHARPIGVAELAKAAGMSRYHFSRRFRAHTGESPYRYLTAYRVERAAERLRGGRTVTAAALDVGFRDLGRFARAFRARYGVTPSAFARNAGRTARSA